jgi:uncharacterized membrane protein YeaQ/YmgE (transglycosylase-associated protein family)
MAVSIHGTAINLDLDTILVVAFAGAVILLLVVRLFAGGGARRRSWT